MLIIYLTFVLGMGRDKSWYVICPCRLRLVRRPRGVYFKTKIFSYIRGDVFDVIASVSLLFFLFVGVVSDVKCHCVHRVDGEMMRRCVNVQGKPSFLTHLDGFLGTSSGHKDHYYRRRHLRLTALVAPPSEGLEHGANTIPDMSSTINGAEQAWFHLPYRVVS